MSLTTTHDLRLDVAGAGSGVNNAIRQVGSVLGSALIAAVMDWRLAATHGDLSRGFGQSMLVPAIEMGLAALVVAFFVRFVFHSLVVYAPRKAGPTTPVRAAMEKLDEQAMQPGEL